MTELTDWLQGERTIPPVLAAGIAQFQLVHIHPFVDGNGRTSRLLSTLCLYRSGINRRSLQRDLADLIEKGIIAQEGIKKATRYRLNRLS
ncbi:MAG: Fic family protein [Simkaniaceae bacterium]|nr:Fic family protein [Simkaniaceae bacterium]